MPMILKIFTDVLNYRIKSIFTSFNEDYGKNIEYSSEQPFFPPNETLNIYAYISLCLQTLNFSVLMLSPSAPSHNPSDATGHTQNSIQTILHAQPTSSLPILHRMIFEFKHINTYVQQPYFQKLLERLLPILENPARKARISFRRKALHTNQNHQDSSSLRLLTSRNSSVLHRFAVLRCIYCSKKKQAEHTLT